MTVVDRIRHTCTLLLKLKNLTFTSILPTDTRRSLTTRVTVFSLITHLVVLNPSISLSFTTLTYFFTTISLRILLPTTFGTCPMSSPPDQGSALTEDPFPILSLDSLSSKSDV